MPGRWAVKRGGATGSMGSAMGCWKGVTIDRSTKDPVHGDLPAGRRGVGFRYFTAGIRGGLGRVRGPVDAHTFISSVNVPHHECACRKVICPFLRHLGFGEIAVII